MTKNSKTTIGANKVTAKRTAALAAIATKPAKGKKVGKGSPVVVDAGAVARFEKAEAAKLAATLTANERKAIEGILASDYMDGETGDGAVGREVWTWSANPFPSPRTFSGVVSSLVQKGFATIGGEGKDATICVTRAGMDAFNADKPVEAKPASNINKLGAAIQAIADEKKAAKRTAKTAAPKVTAEMAAALTPKGFKGFAAKAGKPIDAKSAIDAKAFPEMAKAAAKLDAAKPANGATGAKAQILEMMARKDGVSHAEVCAALHWARAGATISRAIKLSPTAVRKERDAKGELRYFR